MDRDPYSITWVQIPGESEETELDGGRVKLSSKANLLAGTRNIEPEPIVPGFLMCTPTALRPRKGRRGATRSHAPARAKALRLPDAVRLRGRAAQMCSAAKY